MIKLFYKKKFVLGIVTLLIVSVMSSCSGPKDISEKTVEFGTQDGKPIKWQVIAENYSEQVLLSEDILDTMPYNDNDEIASWSETTLYDYLNSDFVNEYFTKEERDKLMFINDEDQGVVTMLSINNLIDMHGEIHYGNFDYYNDKGRELANLNIIAKPNDRALYNEIEVYNNQVFALVMGKKKPVKSFEFAEGASPYWLLDRADDGVNVYYVLPTGFIGETEQNRMYIGIRPVIRIKR